MMTKRRRRLADQSSGISIGGGADQVSRVSLHDCEILRTGLACPALSDIGVSAHEPRAEADTADIPADNLRAIHLQSGQGLGRNASLDPVHKGVDGVQWDRADATATVADAGSFKDSVEVIDVVGAAEASDDALVVVEGTGREDHVVVLGEVVN